MNPKRFQFIKDLFEFERLTRNEEAELIEEVERLQAAQAGLVAAAQAVIEAADLDAATRPHGGLSDQFNFYEVVLTGDQVEALRAALAGQAAGEPATPQPAPLDPAQALAYLSELQSQLELQLQPYVDDYSALERAGEVLHLFIMSKAIKPEYREAYGRIWKPKGEAVK